MALKVTKREVDGVVVIAFEGRIVMGEENNLLRERVRTVLENGSRSIVLNMKKLAYIDSAGLGTLVALHTSARVQGASLRLCHLGSKCKEVLQTTRLFEVFDVDDTEANSILPHKEQPGAKAMGAC
jgi:anti-sigma B factor antagonist